MSKRADKTAARADDDASPSGNGEPPSTLEPSEAFKRPRLASDARKPIQTRAREPRPLWRDHAEETDAPPIAPRRPWRQPRAASPPPKASEVPDATPSEPSEAPTPESNARTLYDTAAASPSPPPPAPTPAPAAPNPGSDANAPGDSPIPAVEPEHYWNQGDLDAPRAEHDLIGSAFALERDGRPRQETQQLTFGDVPARCRRSQSEENEERHS